MSLASNYTPLWNLLRLGVCVCCRQTKCRHFSTGCLADELFQRKSPPTLMVTFIHQLHSHWWEKNLTLTGVPLLLDLKPKPLRIILTCCWGHTTRFVVVVTFFFFFLQNIPPLQHHQRQIWNPPSYAELNPICLLSVELWASREEEGGRGGGSHESARGRYCSLSSVSYEFIHSWKLHGPRYNQCIHWFMFVGLEKLQDLL